MMTKNLWMRLGADLLVTDEEAKAILSGTADEANAAFARLIREGRFRANGNSYIPEGAIADFNAQYGTDYDEQGDIEFEAPITGSFGTPQEDCPEEKVGYCCGYDFWYASEVSGRMMVRTDGEMFARSYKIQKTPGGRSFVRPGNRRIYLDEISWRPL